MPKPKDGKYMKLVKIGVDPTKPIGQNNRIAALQAVLINNEHWYPTSMVAYFMLKDRNSIKEYVKKWHNLADALSFTKGSKQDFPLNRAIRKAFKRLDGNWFTTEKAFNEALASRNRSPIKFEPIVRKNLL